MRTGCSLDSLSVACDAGGRGPHACTERGVLKWTSQSDCLSSLDPHPIFILPTSAPTAACCCVDVCTAIPLKMLGPLDGAFEGAEESPTAAARNGDDGPRLQTRNLTGTCSTKQRGKERVLGIRTVLVQREKLDPSLGLEAGQAGIGMGFERDPRDGSFLVCTLLPRGSCRKNGGIFLNDRLLSVDDIPVQGKSVAEVAEIILGPEGTDVALTVETLDGVQEQAPVGQVESQQHASAAQSVEKASQSAETQGDTVDAVRPSQVLSSASCPSLQRADQRPPEQSGGEDTPQRKNAGSHSAGSVVDGRTIAESLQDCLVLCGNLQRSLEHDMLTAPVSVFAPPTSTHKEANAAQTTLGILFKGCQIDSLVVGGPGASPSIFIDLSQRMRFLAHTPRLTHIPLISWAKRSFVSLTSSLAP